MKKILLLVSLVLMNAYLFAQEMNKKLENKYYKEQNKILPENVPASEIQYFGGYESVFPKNYSLVIGKIISVDKRNYDFYIKRNGSNIFKKIELPSQNKIIRINRFYVAADADRHEYLVIDFVDANKKNRTSVFNLANDTFVTGSALAKLVPKLRPE